MNEEISANLDKPAALERIYRSNKAAFKREFNVLYPEIKGQGLADYWHERLNYESEEISLGSGSELLWVIVGALMAGLIVKLPAIFSIDEEFFFSRNVGFVVVPVLSAYFAWKNKLPARNIFLVAAVLLAGALYINSLPDAPKSDTLTLACIHLVLVLWAVLAYTFVGDWKNVVDKRLAYLRFNGDLLVMSALILIAGGIMSAVTVGLFGLIGMKIEKFYFEYVGIIGIAAAPIVATYLTQTNPQLVGKVSPVIARIFSPLVLVMLIIYLLAILYSGKDPFNDRDFLVVFNALLVGVMAIIFFSVAESSKSSRSQAELWILFLLSAVTIVVNGIALSAIVFRISEWGITPNRAAVLGSNALMLIHLLMITGKLYNLAAKRSNDTGVGKVISLYLPLYIVWALIVVVVFPIVFGINN